MEIDNKKSKFIQVIESLSKLIQNETVAEEMESENINQGLIDAFFLKFSEIMTELRKLVSQKFKEEPKVKLRANNMIDRGHQKETDFMRMDRSLHLGRLIC
jgi:DNA mismatch repair ATPase MutS